MPEEFPVHAVLLKSAVAVLKAGLLPFGIFHKIEPDIGTVRDIITLYDGILARHEEVHGPIPADGHVHLDESLLAGITIPEETVHAYAAVLEALAVSRALPQATQRQLDYTLVTLEKFEWTWQELDQTPVVGGSP